MHAYYAANREKFKKEMDKFLSLVAPELEKASGKKYTELFEEIWDYYERHLLERFPFVGGDKVSGTRNLTGAYYFVAMGEALKRYSTTMEDIGHIMVYSYERNTMKMPGFVRALMGKVYRSPKLLNKMLLKKDEKNAKNAAANPGSFETKTQIPPEPGYGFSYHNLVCTVRPAWLIIPGTENCSSYSDYGHHFKDFLIGCIYTTLMALVFAGIDYALLYFLMWK